MVARYGLLLLVCPSLAVYSARSRLVAMVEGMPDTIARHTMRTSAQPERIGGSIARLAVRGSVANACRAVNMRADPIGWQVYQF